MWVLEIQTHILTFECKALHLQIHSSTPLKLFFFPAVFSSLYHLKFMIFHENLGLKPVLWKIEMVANSFFKNCDVLFDSNGLVIL